MTAYHKPGLRQYGNLTDADANLVIACIEERKRLQKEIRELSDYNLAKKFCASRSVIRRISRELE